MLAQVSDDDEVIVVDDFSTDDTGAVAAGFNVKVVRLSRHLGISAARNRGVDLTTAPVLFFYDSDVVLAPGALSPAKATMIRPELGPLIASSPAHPASP